MDENIEMQIYEVIRSVQGEVSVDLSAGVTFEELGISSIELVSIIYQLENHWNISIADSNFEELRTIADARDLIVKILKSKREISETVPELGEPS